MPTITVNIADSLTPLNSGETSPAGHMWITTDDGNSYGFGPQEQGKPFGEGTIIDDDETSYKEKYFSKDFSLTEDQYNDLKDFLTEPTKYNFSMDYDFWTNSCVDFVFKCLEVAGINIDGHEGDCWPGNNRDNLERLDPGYIPGASLLDPNAPGLISRPPWSPALPPATAPMGLTDPIPTSPLVLDLDGDGIETVGMASGIQFDLNNNGFCETVGWVGADDGLLALDRNGDGAITGGFELFGNNTLLESGRQAANGFLALAEFDGNKDGFIDVGDDVFSQLRVWRDADQNGESDAGELLTLEEAGVSRLNLGYSVSATKDAFGNEFRQLGGYVDAEGNSLALTDVWFNTNPTLSRPMTEIPVSEEILTLPNAAGFGNVRSLHEGRGLWSSFATMQNLTVCPVFNHFQ